MKRFWATLAVTGFAIFAAVGCNDYGNTFQNPTGAALSSVSPSQIPAGGGAFTITMNGGGFVAQTKVQWNGKTCPSSSSSGASTAPCTTTVTLDSNNNVLSVTASISASLIAKPGTASVNTINPASGTGNNGLSNTLTFIIDNPNNLPPTVSSVSPTCVTVGSALSLTVTGSNFLSGPASAAPPQISTLVWTFGGSQTSLTPSTTPPTTITSSQITVTIPATSITAVGNATVAASNPPSLPLPTVPGSVGGGGGPSPATTITIQPAGGTCPAVAKAQVASEASNATAEESPTVSADGRYVAYAAVLNERSQIFLRDTCEGAPANCRPRTSVLSVASNGEPASGDSHTPSMSSDGRYVAFSSDTMDLAENPTSGRQIYLRDTCAGANNSCKPSTQLISTDSSGALTGAESILPSVSSSGRFVAFLAITPSHAPNSSSSQLKSSSSSTNSGFRQVFVRDTCLGASNCTPKTTRISLLPGDGVASGTPPAGPALSGQAKHVAIAGAAAATLFTRSVAVDDSVFLAITSDQR